jgi:hypothetical protein
MAQFLRLLTAQTLKECLSNTAAAAAMYPAAERKGFFVTVLRAMAAKAVEKQLPATIFDTWLAERDNAEYQVDVEDVDFADFKVKSQTIKRRKTTVAA